MGYFDDTPHKVTSGNIVYANDLNAPLAAIEASFESLAEDIQNGTNIHYATDTGVANAYVVSLDPVPSVYTEGLHVWLKPLNANTGASTLNVNGLGAISILRTGGCALSAGDLAANYYIGLKYNGSVFQMYSGSPISEANAAASASAAAASAATAATSTAATTIAALIALDVSSITKASVLGYHSAGDGGGGLFVWSASGDKANHNGGTIIDPDISVPTDWTNQTQLTTWFTAGTGSGVWVRDFVGDVPAEWFGAKGDDSTDEYLPIQTALDSNVGNVTLAKKSYRFETKLTINDPNIVLIGSGKDRTYLKWYGAGTALESDYTVYGSSLGSIVWEGFTLSDYGTGTTVGFDLNRFTKGCVLRDIKIASFNTGITITDSWYSSILHCDIESCDIGLSYGDTMNDFEIFNCTFTSNKIHITEGSGSTASYGFIIRDCAFDGMGLNGDISLDRVVKGVITGCYFEVYTGDSGLANDAITIGSSCIAVSIENNIMIGPGDANYTGKWINIAASSNHSIKGNYQYRASGATFLTVATGAANIAYEDNRVESSDGTIVDGTIIVKVVSVRVPATTSTTDIVIGLFKTPKTTGFVRVLFIPDATDDLTGINLRVIRSDTSAVLIDQALGSYTALDVVDCGSIAALAGDITLVGGMVKGGSNVDSCAGTLILEYY